MKRISRAMLRGEALEPYCKKANTTTMEYGVEDKRVYKKSKRYCKIWRCRKL